MKRKFSQQVINGPFAPKKREIFLDFLTSDASKGGFFVRIEKAAYKAVARRPNEVSLWLNLISNKLLIVLLESHLNISTSTQP